MEDHFGMLLTFNIFMLFHRLYIKKFIHRIELYHLVNIDPFVKCILLLNEFHFLKYLISDRVQLSGLWK